MLAGNDINITQEGNLVVDANGDLEIASASTTVFNTINFLLKTDKGQYLPDLTVGCNLGTLMGQLNNEETSQLATDFVRRELSRGYLDSSEFEVATTILEQDLALLLLSVSTNALEPDLTLQTVNMNVAYQFPYLSGALTKVYENEW